MKRTYFGYILALWVLQAVAVAFVVHQPLFWDNVLLSGKIPTELWSANLSTLFVDEKMAGYSPLWGAYIAQGWLWFGRSLLTTHLLMLPFLWMISYQLVRLAQQFVARRVLGLTIAGLMSVPVLTALSVQCGPDLAMLALYLTALNAILTRNRVWLSFILVILALVTPRGMWCLVPLFILDQLLLGNKLFALRWLWAFSKALAFSPAALAVGVWYYLHYQHYGWLFTNPNGPFATLAEYTTLPEYLRQLGICLWRMVDFGQIAVWGPLLIIFITVLRGKVEAAQHRWVLMLITVVPTLAFSFFFASFRNPVGHRYLLIPVLMATLWLCYEWGESLRYDRFRTRILWVLLFFWTGHLWVAAYPASIAKGWDATLLHLQAGAAKRDMLASIQKLTPNEQADIGALFPDVGPWGDVFLDTTTLTTQELDTAQQMLWLYSSASNEFDHAEVATFPQRAQERVRCTYWPVTLVLWESKRLHTTPTRNSVK
jgi:hypothetical protein